MEKTMNSSKLHIAMFPWLAYGHMIPFLELANQLAEKGHKISFLLPNKAHLKLANANLHPNLITFHALSVPHVDGLPRGAETTHDTDDAPALSLAMDGMRDEVKAVLEAQKPNFVIFDFADWIPVLASEIGCKTVAFHVASPAVALQALAFVNQQAGNDMLRRFLGKGVSGGKQSDALAVRACSEMEGAHCDALALQYGKPVLCTGPLLPKPKEGAIEAKIENWLQKFGPGSVVLCAFGSETVLEITQFQELVLGLDLTGLPFMVAVTKAPKGTDSIGEALPEGFEERVKEKGMVHQGWVPQSMILKHKSVGCFVSLGGSASMWESLVSDCRIVVAPIREDYGITARLMAHELGVAVQVERGENGWFSKESFSEAVKLAMGVDGDSQRAILLKENHNKWRDVLLSPGFADNYIHKFLHNLNKLLGQ